MLHGFNTSNVDERSSARTREALMCTCETRGRVHVVSAREASAVPSSSERSEGHAPSHAVHACASHCESAAYMLPVRTSLSNEDDAGSILVSQPNHVSRISRVRREGRRKRLGRARSPPNTGCGGTSTSLVTRGTL